MSVNQNQWLATIDDAVVVEHCARRDLALKRAFDIVFAAILIVVLAPIFIVAALAIKVTSRGSVFYRQERLKQHRQRFIVLKFRTMVDGADRMLENVIHLNTASGPLFKIESDPRITWVGRILRKTFIDELPQLINVLRGDMSLVGPRPCLPAEAERMSAYAELRFAMPQGITGPWQVNGHHKLTFEQQLTFEREYVREWSFRRDLEILIRTIPLVLRRTGI